MEEEMLEKIQKGHTFRVNNNDTVIWQFKEPITHDQADAIIDDLNEHIPETKHLVVPDLEDVYVVKNEEVDKK